MNEFKITEEKENALFNRKEIKGSIESEVVHSRVETLEILSKKFRVPSRNIKIKKILGKFGSKVFDVEANIYSSEKDKESIELKKKKEKLPEKKSEEVVEEKSKQEKTEEEPEQKKEAEPPKEEPKPEEKAAESQQDTKSESQENSEPQGETNK